MHIQEMVGKRFGRLVVTRRVSGNKYKQPMFECICDCGRYHTTQKSSLVRETKGVRSCGCLYRTVAIRRHENQKKLAPHGIQTTSKPSKLHARKMASIKQTARRRGIKWQLSDDQLLDLVKLPCTYCGGSSDHGSGLDRVDTSKAYAKENVNPCCKYCNFAKGPRSLDEFKNWITSAYKITCFN